MKRISKKVREEACWVLGACASWDVHFCDFPDVGTLEDAAATIGASEPGARLARDAYYSDQVPFPPHWNGREVFACAEQLLRTGWSP